MTLNTFLKIVQTLDNNKQKKFDLFAVNVVTVIAFKYLDSIELKHISNESSCDAILTSFKS
jgi:hypothetical protein